MLRQLGYANFYAYSKAEIWEELQHHVRGLRSRKGSRWTSFTASIISAIGFALRMKDNGETTIRIHIIDTTQLSTRPLVVHCHRMLKAYEINLSASLCFDVARTRTSWNEFLVWDELRAVASSVDLDDLLYPEAPNPKACQPGLLDLMPKLKTPEKDTWDQTKASESFSRHYGLEVEPYEVVQSPPLSPSPLSDTDYMIHAFLNNRTRLQVRRGWTRDGLVYRTNWHLLDYFFLVRSMTKSFQLPMVVALLSMGTKFMYQESVIRELMEFPKGKQSPIPDRRRINFLARRPPTRGR